MKLKIVQLLMVTAIIFSGCSDEKKEEAAQQQSQNITAQDVHQVTIEEILQANAYTYLRVKDNGKEDWIAVTKMENVEKGQTLYYTGAMEMKNFHSTDLDRDFESVWFVQTISDQPLTGTPMMSGKMPHSNVKPKADESISIKPVAGGITIAQLFDNKSEYESKDVKIKGKVVKVNNGIMGRNWVHIQDGTGSEKNYDLTVTTDAQVQVGQIVLAEGYVSLNKDFGSGYTYDIILENAKLTPEKKM